MSLPSLSLTPGLTERVYRAIQEAILNGEMAPGARLTQEELATQLAVSRQPVLQALRLLKRDGFVVDAPAKGCGRSGVPRGTRGVMVSALQANDIRQIYQVRAALDGLAARAAAQSRAHLPAALIERGRRTAEGQGIAEMIDVDVAFHEAIYAASGNPYIAEAAQRHWHPIRRAIGAVLKHHAARDSVWDEHDAILAAISSGDAVRAEALARQHAEQAGEVLAQRLEAQAGHLRQAQPLTPSTTSPSQESA